MFYRRAHLIMWHSKVNTEKWCAYRNFQRKHFTTYYVLRPTTSLEWQKLFTTVRVALCLVFIAHKGFYWYIMNHQTYDPYASRLDLQMWGVWDGGGWYSVIYHKCNYSSISTPLLHRRFNLTTVKVRERMGNCIPTFHLSIPEFWYWFS